MATSKKLDLSAYEAENNLQTGETHIRHNKYTQYLENELTKPSTNQGEYKRINMAFTDGNYQFIQDETARLGINCAHFLNSLIRIIDAEEIDKYVSSQPLRKGNNAIRRKGHPLKRINLKFQIDTYQRLATGADRNGTTLTQYLNMILEVYKHGENI